MKQSILSIVIFVLTLSSTRSNAQRSGDMAINYRQLSLNVEDEKLEAADVNTVNIKAVRNFNRSHKHVSNPKWFTTDEGFTAGFSSEGKSIKVVYDKKGTRQYEIISYTQEHLDAGIRKLVKSNYYDNSIIGIHQFEFEYKTVYVVKMLDPQSVPVTLTVCDGQIKDITSRKK